MIKPAQWIAEHGPKIIKPYDEKLVNPASYDVTLHDEIFIRGDEKVKLPFKFAAGEFIIASTIEFFELPLDIAGDLKLKSSIGRKGINHALSGWIDPGFKGMITLELQNISGAFVTLEPGMKIAQLVFMQLSEPTSLSYERTGRYCNQTGPTLAREERKR
jgi:dCTP deaminase